MTIHSTLVPALQQRFASRGVVVGQPPAPIATFPAQHPDVGDLIVLDDGSEATVLVGELTHGHFNSYEPSLSPDELAREVTESVLRFLDDLFADRVLLWTIPGKSGGWETLTEEPPHFPQGAQTFVWSGSWNPQRNVG